MDGAARRRAGEALARGENREPVFLAAAAVGAAVMAAAVVAVLSGGGLSPSPAAVVGASVPGASAGPSGAPGADPVAPTEAPLRAPATEVESTAIPRRGDVDPAGGKAGTYLAALREADIPASRSGLPETEAAAVICEQLEAGADEDALVRALPAVLPTVTRAQAVEVVAIAGELYC